MTDAVEVYEREDGKWAYRVKGENGEVMSQSQGYANVFNANRGAQDLVRRLKEVDKNVIASVDEGPKEPELGIMIFGSDGMRSLDSVGTGVTRRTGFRGAVVDATGMDVVVKHDTVIITVVGPKNKDSYKMVIKGENLKLLKKGLIAAESAVPTKEAYLMSIIERASTYTATPPSIETLITWVDNDRGIGGNPFDKTNLDSDVRAVVVDLFFARRIKTDNKKGLVIVEVMGRQNGR